MADNPEESASTRSRILFSWVGSIIKKASHHTLTEEDVWKINQRDECKSVFPPFQRHWKDDEPTSNSSNGHEDEIQEHTEDVPSDKNLRQRKREHDTQDKTGSKPDKSEPKDYVHSYQSRPAGVKRHKSLVIAILRTFWRRILLSLSFKFWASVSLWSTPFLIGLVIDSTADSSSSMWTSLTHTMLLVGIIIFGRLLEEHGNYYKQLFQCHVEAILKDAVFRKALNLHTSSRSKFSVGQMTNLMSSDVSNIAGGIANIQMLFFTPLNIIVMFGQLFHLLGPAAALGLVVMVIFTPFNLYIAERISDLFVQNAQNKDDKMKLLNEVLTGIKVVKLHAWELCFGDMLRDIRKKEVEVLKLMTYYRTLHIFSWNTAPYMISLAMFSGYFFLYPGIVFTAKAAFAVLSALNMLRFSINLAPDILNDYNKITVSARRLEDFLIEKETHPLHSEPTENIGINITNGTFTWDSSSTPILRNVDMHISESSSHAVVGQVGAGKSTLLSAILGESVKLSGHVSVMGKIAYVPQQAWIQNETLQNNILFGKPMNKHVYNKVVKACALQPDLDVLPAGDQTEIGERGINLSGGQKQRVSLARAVYNDADIYLLDDPLSAVDSHVGKHIFDNVIKGMLKDKICILVIHNLRYLPEVDNILVLDRGRVAESGSFKQLITSDGAFTQVLKTYITDYEENRDCLEEMEAEEDLDIELRRGLKRLESQDASDVKKFGRQESEDNNKTFSRQSSRHKSTSQSEDEIVPVAKVIVEEKPLSLNRREKLELFGRYIQAYGVWNMVGLILFYVLYYAMYILSHMLMVWWTNDENLHNIQDDNVEETRSLLWKTNMMYLAMYTILGLLMSLFIFLFAFMMSKGVVRASQRLHDDMLSKILHAPMEFFDKTPLGRITNRFSHDMKVVDDAMPSCLEFWLDCVFNVVIAVAVVVYTTPEVTVILIPLFFYYNGVQSCFIPIRSQTNMLRVQRRTPIESYFTESVTGAEVIRAFRAQSRFGARMESFIDRLNNIRIIGHAVYRWWGISTLATGNVIFGVGTFIQSLTKGTKSAAVLGFTSSFTRELNGGLRWLVFMQCDLETNLTSVERIERYIHVPQEAEWRSGKSLLPPGWPIKGKVEFRDFSLRYRQGLDCVLNKISFTVEGGEKVGVVGRTGAGKSSLMISLFRLVEPAEGAIYIDEVDISHIGLHDLREKLAIIPQDPVLFSGTLRMNLDPQNVYTDPDIWAALDHTHLKHVVESLPNKLLTECEEGGRNFSVGQRQLFCLARTLLQKAQILVMDEATAAVDMETDDLIQQTIRSEFKGCTVLTIAHRLNTVMDYDRILVLERGTMAEFDTPSTLLKRPSSIFCKMAKVADIV